MTTGMASTALDAARRSARSKGVKSCPREAMGQAAEAVAPSSLDQPMEVSRGASERSKPFHSSAVPIRVKRAYRALTADGGDHASAVARRQRKVPPYSSLVTSDGRTFEVRRAKVRDRGEAVAAEKIRFSSSILPKWARRTKSLDALLPALYLRGVSTGDFQEALAALLGKDARNLSPAVIARLTAEWQADYDA